MTAPEPSVRRRSRWLDTTAALARARGTRIGGLIFLALVAFCLLWPLISPYGANEIDFSQGREGPSVDHPLGTDQFGRDLLTRLAVGGRTSLLIAFAALGIILTIGTLYGAIAGLAGGWLDSLMMRGLDGMLALPRLPIYIVILVILGFQAQNVATVALALGIVGWMLTARLVRGEVRALKTREYIVAARALGARSHQIARRHLIPNSLGIIVIAAFLELPAVILGEAFLSTLGVGPAPPTATWGSIATEGIHFFRLWPVLLASAAIALFAISANLIVDGLHDALDPRRPVRRETRRASRRRGRSLVPALRRG